MWCTLLSGAAQVHGLITGWRLGPSQSFANFFPKFGGSRLSKKSSEIWAVPVDSRYLRIFRLSISASDRRLHVGGPTTTLPCQLGVKKGVKLRAWSLR